MELKFDFLRDFCGWQLLIIDESDFMKLSNRQEKEKFISSLLKQPESDGEEEPK